MIAIVIVIAIATVTVTVARIKTATETVNVVVNPARQRSNQVVAGTEAACFYCNPHDISCSVPIYVLTKSESMSDQSIMHNAAKASEPKRPEKKRIISGIMMRHLPRGLVGVSSWVRLYVICQRDTQVELR